VTGPFGGQTAVVTGASRGIGRSTAIELARAGARVFAAARSAQPLQELETSLRAEGYDLTAVPSDVSVESQVESLFAEADQAGGTSILVCAAGMLRKAPVDQMDIAVWRMVVDVNLTGTFLCCKRAFQSMKRLGGGRIVTISSLSGVYGTDKFPGNAAYNASKAGVVGLTEGVAVEGRPYGISAVCLSPGAVDTQMLREANSDLRPGLQPEQVAQLIVRLLDSPMAWFSGANIPLFSNL
jgi:3-oxoacyl-[acyl-carrier protein] reductase